MNFHFHLSQVLKLDKSTSINVWLLNSSLLSLADDNRKTLKEGVVPSLNLPQKSIQKKDSVNRPTSQIEKREAAKLATLETPLSPCYKDFTEFIKRSKCLKLTDFFITEVDDQCFIVKKDTTFAIARFEIRVNNELNFMIRVFGWLLNENCFVVSSYEGSMRNVTLSKLVKELETSDLCSGIDFQLHINHSDKSVKRHVIPKLNNSSNSWKQHITLSQDEYLRANKCHVLVKSSSKCPECIIKEQYELKQLKTKETTECLPAKLKAPLSATKPVRVKLALQQSRLQCKQLENEVAKMKQEIKNSSKPVSPELGDDFKQIFSTCDDRKIPPFMKLFWLEQQKYIQQSPSQVRYHPMIIKFCLAVAAKSTAAYNELRLNDKVGSGVMVLPSLRTLRDYRNYIRPKRGFNDMVVTELQSKTSNFTACERYIIISFDEMKIQEDLVWDKNSGELIGFIDLGDAEINYATLDKSNKLATHVLVFLIKSVVNPLSYSFATFATDGITSFQLFPLFWRAVAILETTCSLCVIAAVADGASSNRTFFNMHKSIGAESEKKVTYRSVNLFAQYRFIYFLSDAPHLMKTARNNLAKSGSGKGTRLLWNNGCYILWSHISQIYNEDLECGLKLLPKLTSDHVNLTPYSVMRVKLAVQVLSSSMAKVLKAYGPDEASGTATFCEYMDKFFDCANVRNTQEHHHKQKAALRPYESLEDPRFEWLENRFLKYFEDWQKSITERQGNFTKSNKEAMFISWQTYRGLQMTVYSLVDVTKYLLSVGVKYVLTERFCQDDLENYFGRQRSIGHRRDNPNLRSVGYNDNIIKSQFSITPIAGNVQSGSTKMNVISDEPLPKRKKSNK